MQDSVEHTAEEKAELEAVKEEYAHFCSSSDVLVIGIPDYETEFRVQIGWWYEDYR